MSDFQQVRSFGNPVLNTYSTESIGPLSFATESASIGQAAWPTANKAFFIPVRISVSVIILKMLWFNGTTVGTNNVDVGIYDNQGNKIVSSGSILTSGTSSFQEANITDTTIEPGLYYMAMAMDGTTDTVRRQTDAVPEGSFYGILEQASAFNLPANATFAAHSAAYIPYIGMTNKTLI